MHASLETVLKSNVYMCFYVKRHLDYKPFSLPTYKIARENEAVKEREKEKEKEREKEKDLGKEDKNRYRYEYLYLVYVGYSISVWVTTTSIIERPRTSRPQSHKR